MKSILTVLLLCTTIAIVAQEETCNRSCSCRNNLTPAGVMISHIHDKNEWMISYRYMNMQMNGLLSGSQVISKEDAFSKYIMAPDGMVMNMHMLMLMYGISDRLTVMSMVNFSTCQMNMSMFSATEHHHGMNNTSSHYMQTAGLNDVKLYAAYGLVKKETCQLSLFAGVSLPTGSVYMKGSSTDMLYANKRLPYSMQPGSGCLALLPALNYLFQKNQLACSLQLSGTIHPWYNVIGYTPGNDVSLNAWAAYSWHGCVSSSLRLETTIAEKIKGYDPTLFYYNEPSANPGNYGGKRIAAYIGSVFQMKKGCFKNQRFGLEYGIPLYQAANGIQMKLKQTFNASWAINF